MKVLINALGANTGGAMRHLTNFLPELAQADRRCVYVCLVRSDVVTPPLADNIIIRRVSSRWVRNPLLRLLFDVVIIPFHLRFNRFDCVVSLTNFGPIWSPVKHVVFQRNPIYFCSYYFNCASTLQRLDAVVRRAFVVAIMKRAEVIVTPSDAMATMIKAASPALSGRPFRTLYHGFDSHSLADRSEVLEQRFARCTDSTKMVYPTHIATHKGFEILFRVLQTLVSAGLNIQLYLTVSQQEVATFPSVMRYAQSSQISRNIVYLGAVPRKQMGCIYQACDLMIYPSLCESFGFSMVEAMGFGLPIVAADTAVNREICRDAALYYPPLNAAAASNVVVEALDEEVQRNLRLAAARRMASFDWSWRRNAREFTMLVARVMADEGFAGAD